MNRKAELEALEWNEKFKFPMKVILTDGTGIQHETRTRSIAWISGGRAVVLVEGRVGGYLLSRIRPALEVLK